MESSNQEKLIEAAERVITEKGIKAASLADIAKEAGISKGTLYYYYASKNDLVYDIADRHLSKITDQLIRWTDEITAADKPEQIVTLAFEMITGEFTRGRLHLYLMQETVTGNEGLRQRFISKYEEWQNMIESELVKLFGASRPEVNTLSRVILAALDGFTIQSLLGVAPDKYGPIANVLVKGPGK